MDKKKTLKEMREEIKQMIEASQRRQKGEKVTSQDIKENPIGTRAKSVKAENFRTDVDTGMKAQKSKDYSKAKTSGTYMVFFNVLWGYLLTFLTALRCFDHLFDLFTHLFKCFLFVHD